MYLRTVEHKQHSTSLRTDRLFLTSRVDSESAGAEYSLRSSHSLAALLRQPADDNGVWPVMTTVRFEPVTRR